MDSKPPILPLVLAVALALQGCAAAVVGAGAGAAKVATDRRTLGTQIDDSTLANRIATALARNEDIKNQSNVNVEVFNGTVLLVGQAPTESLKQQIENIASSINHINKLHNQIRISQPVAITTTTNDVWLASKVRTQLITDERINGLHVSVTVEDSEVFLMGLVSRQEADIAVDIARNINGVARVIKVFEIN